MKKVSSLEEVVKNELCISCGACVAAAPTDSIVLKYRKKNHALIPVIQNHKNIDGKGLEFSVCPGKGYDIVQKGYSLSAGKLPYDLYIGFAHSYWAARTNNNLLLKNASSGGVMTEIASYLLESNRVQGVVATKMTYGSEFGPTPIPIIAQSTEELVECQGSKYMPVPAVSIVGSLNDFSGNVAFIGTPCQIGGIRLLQEKNEYLKRKIPFVIGNFCGGFKEYPNTQRMIIRNGFNPNSVTSFRFRDGGQPGSLYIDDNGGNSVRIPYPNYTKITGYSKTVRCRLCVDGSAELADFSCGDAWLDKYLSDPHPWSILISRSPEMTGIVHEMVDLGKLTLSKITLDEIKDSQRSNFKSKKNRQKSRRKVFKYLGRAVPEYDGGYSFKESTIITEVRVHFFHKLTTFLEDISFYLTLRRIIDVIRKFLPL